MRTRYLIRLLPLCILIAVFLAAVLAAPRFISRTDRAAAQDGLSVSLDMDTTDGGPCADIDASVTHGVGDDYAVGICVEGLSVPLSSMELHVLYDDTLNYAPEITCPDSNCLDDNPDANAGNTSWGDGLGGINDGGWDCDIMSMAEPIGDWDSATGPGHGLARISCWSLTGPFALGDNESSGVLAVINFQATDDGVDNMALSGVVLANEVGEEIGSCNFSLSLPMPCSGGTVNNEMPTPIPTPTPCPGGICPTATPIPTPAPDSDGDGVTDPSDRCPRNAEDVDGFQDRDGCPDTDNDTDLISDRLDVCPDAREDIDGINDTDGCPDLSVIATFPMQPEGSTPGAVAADYYSYLVYIADTQSNNVSVFELSTNTLVGTIPIPGAPSDIGVLMGGSICISYRNGAAGGVLVNGEWMSPPTADIPIEDQPAAIAVDPTRGRVFVAGSEGGNFVTVIDTGVNTVISQVLLEEGGVEDIAVNLGTNFIYVAGRSSQDGYLCWIDGEQLSETDSPDGCISLGDKWPRGVAVSSLTNRIYVSDYSGDSVSVYQGRTHELIGEIAVGDMPYGVAVNESTNHVFVANSGPDTSNNGNTVSVIDSVTNTLLDNVAVGEGPWHLSADESSRLVHIANRLGQSISVIQDGDWDGDGVAGDNCPYVYNLNQADADGDHVGDACDNCPNVYNDHQENTPLGSFDNGPDIPGDDLTLPEEDNIGDACDDDFDNDGLIDSQESDDACPYRMVWDSDGDGSLDGYEVAHSADPCDPEVGLLCRRRAAS